MKLTYSVVIEQYPSNYGAYAPDVPGCFSTAGTPDEMLAMIREALTFHIEATVEHGDPVPMPTRSVDDAIACHCQAVFGHEADWLTEFGEFPSTLWMWFQSVEVEIPAPHAARAEVTA